METSTQYRQFAGECDRMAKQADTERQRDILRENGENRQKTLIEGVNASLRLAFQSLSLDLQPSATRPGPYAIVPPWRARP
jgi:hypothetical protein